MTTQTLSQKPARAVPAAGMGATGMYPQDRYPMRVVKVSDTGHAIWLTGVRSVDRTTGHLPAHSCNGYPVWDHTYSDAELDLLEEAWAAPTKATLRKDGTYRVVGEQTHIAVGRARYFRNFAD